MCIFKQYANVFGAPGKGVHAHRFMGVAVVDFALTVLAALLTSYYTDVPLTLSLVGWLLAGLFAHWLFGVKTGMTKYFGIGC